jgi:hypothetical protein
MDHLVRIVRDPNTGEFAKVGRPELVVRKTK